MTDKALENAKAIKRQANQEIERLEAELRAWRDRMVRAEQFIDQWKAFASGEIANLASEEPTQENKPEPSKAKRSSIRNSKKEDVAAAALEVIRERGEPVSRSDLYTALIERGLTIEGTDPEMVLSTMLWRMKETVMRFKNGGYWDPKADWEPAGYKAELLDETQGRERDFVGIGKDGDLI